jgi:hypothetical protein
VPPGRSSSPPRASSQQLAPRADVFQHLGADHQVIFAGRDRLLRVIGIAGVQARRQSAPGHDSPPDRHRARLDIDPIDIEAGLG